MNTFVQTIDGLQEILGICPCCGEIFRLVEAKFIFPRTRARRCEYLDLTKVEKQLDENDAILTEAERELEEMLDTQRERLRESGRKQAKKRLKEIDPTFSGNQIDPQCVKLIFHPVEYIVFHGLKSGDGVASVELLSRNPESALQERIVRSITQVIKRGDVEFETLHMNDDGSFNVRRLI